MKDKDLRKMLGVHGDTFLCACGYTSGEIPGLWERIRELEKGVEELKKKPPKTKGKKR